MGAETQPFQQQPVAAQQQAAPSGLWGPETSSSQPYSNIQATQINYGPAPPQPTAAVPAPIAQGYSMGPINTAQPMHCPAQQVTVADK